MKTVNLIPLLAAALSAASCVSDIITDDPTTPSGSATSIGEDDFIDDSDFNRTVTISWSGSSVTVSGDEEGFASVNGSQVTVDSRSDTTKVVKYILTGSSSDGSFKLYSTRKQALVLQNLSLSNSGGAAINNQSGKRTFVVLEGSSTLADGALTSSGDYADATSGEDLKAAFFSEGQMIFSGSGSLSVTATGKAGITSDDYLRFLGTGSISATSSGGHAIRGKDAICIESGIVSATTSAAGKKAFSTDGNYIQTGGDATAVTSGGVLSEDGDLSGAAGIKCDGGFSITGGTLTITSTGQGGKGISGDGNAVFGGGTVIVNVSGTNYGSSSSGGFPGSSSSSSDNSVGAKGIKFDGDVLVSGGSVSVNCKSHEAFEAKGALTVTGGILYAYSAGDDAINRGGSDTSKDMTLSGGIVCGWSDGNDGIDSNGNIYINGATVYAVSTKGAPEVAVDANSEAQRKLYLQNGTVIAVGGLESGFSASGSAYTVAGWTKNAWHSVSSSGSEFVFKTPSSGSSLVVYTGGSQPEVLGGISTSGGTEIIGGYGLEGGSVSGGTSLSLSAYTGGGGNGGGGGGGRPGR